MADGSYAPKIWHNSEENYRQFERAHGFDIRKQNGVTQNPIVLEESYVPKPLSIPRTIVRQGAAADTRDPHDLGEKIFALRKANPMVSVLDIADHLDGLSQA